MSKGSMSKKIPTPQKGIRKMRKKKKKKYFLWVKQLDFPFLTSLSNTS
jgi:hypothetical protein